jgi:glycosyltransferase involved in cell wall biosynthesis
MNPKVSICIPTFERPGLLRQSLASCLGQTFGDFEIVITDNSRSGETEDLVKALGDRRIRYQRNPENIGPLRNMAQAAALGRGTYLKLLMDDDLLKPDCLAKMVRAMEDHPGVGIVMAPMDLIDASGRRIYPRFYMVRRMTYRYRYQVGDGRISRRRLMRDFLTRDYPCSVPSGILIRRECLDRLGPMDPAADFALDLELCMRISAHYDAYYLDEVLASWRFLEACWTAQLHQAGMNIRAFYYITRKILSLPAIPELFPDERERRRLTRDAFFFATCRSLLNFPAAWRSKNPRLAWTTWRIGANGGGSRVSSRGKSPVPSGQPPRRRPASRVRCFHKFCSELLRKADPEKYGFNFSTC